MSREFFCHSNLTFTPQALSERRTRGTFTPVPDLQLVTLVPGRLEVSLPEGFGLPVFSDEPLDYYSMSLNLNEHDGARRVRFRTTISFTPDGARDRPMTPLFRRALYAYEPIGKRSPYTMCQSADHPGAACGMFVGQGASNAFLDSIGKTNTMHWMIPPGRYESRVPVTDQLELPADTTAHYVTAHLHPYARFVSLVDTTTGMTLFTIWSKDFADRRGVAHIDEWRSIDGVPLHGTHSYELVTVYDNPTAQPIDAMSILYVYAVDTRFQASLHARVGAADRLTD